MLARQALLLLVVHLGGVDALRVRGARAQRRVEVRARPGFATLPSSAIVVVDMDNVRGKTQFAMSHEGLIARASRWAAAHRMRGRVMLALDHGAATQGFDLRQLG
eukprot:2369049-Prymnesium_polylepis.1